VVGGPSGVSAQALARMSAFISPSPVKKPATWGLPFWTSMYSVKFMARLTVASADETQHVL
jgi:hypothetical protein